MIMINAQTSQHVAVMASAWHAQASLAVKQTCPRAKSVCVDHLKAASWRMQKISQAATEADVPRTDVKVDSVWVSDRSPGLVQVIYQNPACNESALYPLVNVEIFSLVQVSTQRQSLCCKPCSRT